MSDTSLTAAVAHLDQCSYADGDDVCGEAIRAVREHSRATNPAATEGDEPWLPMPVERAIERLDRSTAADTISEHRHAVITLQNFARHHLAATPRAEGEVALTTAWAQHFEDTAAYAGGFTEPERAGIRAAARMMRDPNVAAQVAKTVGGET